MKNIFHFPPPTTRKKQNNLTLQIRIFLIFFFLKKDNFPPIWLCHAHSLGFVFRLIGPPIRWLRPLVLLLERHTSPSGGPLHRLLAPTIFWSCRLLSLSASLSLCFASDFAFRLALLFKTGKQEKKIRKNFPQMFFSSRYPPFLSFSTILLHFLQKKKKTFIQVKIWNFED